ncbi:MAG: response regulator [Pseudobdellovibrionaceae bacterium]|nr:response regulator [Pseudobdellovibrionaceae bacterium]
MRVLIVDDEEELRELYELILSQKYSLQTHFAGSGQEAVRLLDDLGTSVELVVSDFNMPNGNGDLVYDKAKTLGIPFILVTSDRREDHPEFSSAQLFAFIQKPFNEEEMFQAVERLMEEKRQYIPLSLHTLLKIGNLKTPIYLRLPSGKMVKVFNQGDQFSRNSFDHWNAKNVAHFYVHRNDFIPLISEFKNQVLNEVFFNSIEKQPQVGISVSQEILEVIGVAAKRLAISDEVMELTSKNVELVLRIINSNGNLIPILEGFNPQLKDGVLARSHLTALISTFLSKEFDFKYPRSAECLAMAAFFHDIGLDDEIIVNEGPYIQGAKLGSVINRDKIERVKRHIDDAIELLRGLRGVPQEVFRLIYEHHELPDGSGYPKGLKAEQLSELSAFFIVAHQFVECFFDPNTKKNLLIKWLDYASVFSHPRYQKLYQFIATRLEHDEKEKTV